MEWGRDLDELNRGGQIHFRKFYFRQIGTDKHRELQAKERGGKSITPKNKMGERLTPKLSPELSHKGNFRAVVPELSLTKSFSP